MYAGASGQVNDFEVAPGGYSPLLISAVAYYGGTNNPNIVPNATFTWAGRFVNPLTDPTSISTYKVGPAPSGFKSCPAKPAVTPAVPILQQGGSGVASTLYPGFTIMTAAQTATEVFVGPVPGVTAPYCLLIQATSVPSGVIGAHTVIVSQSP
jgi:hypothetical protein